MYLAWGGSWLVSYRNITGSASGVKNRFAILQLHPHFHSLGQTAEVYRGHASKDCNKSTLPFFLHQSCNYLIAESSRTGPHSCQKRESCYKTLATICPGCSSHSCPPFWADPWGKREQKKEGPAHSIFPPDTNCHLSSSLKICFLVQPHISEVLAD